MVYSFICENNSRKLTVTQPWHYFIDILKWKVRNLITTWLIDRLNDFDGMSTREALFQTKRFIVHLYFYFFYGCFSHTVIWYQVFLSNTNNLQIVIWFHVFLVSYQIIILIWFQELFRFNNKLWVTQSYKAWFGFLV